MTPRTIQVTFRYPDGSVKLAAPDRCAARRADARLPRPGRTVRRRWWGLGGEGVHAYPGERTLAELGVLDGGVLVLHRPPDGHRWRTDRRERPVFARSPWPPGPRSRGEERPLRDRDRPHATAEALAARALPARPRRPGGRSGARRRSRACPLERSRPADVHPPRAPLPHRAGYARRGAAPTISTSSTS